MERDLALESENVMSTGKVDTKLKLGPRSAGMRMTPEEFDAVTRYDDRYCYELIHGVLVVNPIPLEAEGDPNEELGPLGFVCDKLLSQIPELLCFQGVICPAGATSSGKGPGRSVGFLLRSYKHDHPLGSALDKTLAERYVRTLDSRRRADRVIWAGLGRLPDPQVDVPSIVAEFVSAGKRNRLRDYEEKRNEYLAIGVKEYWVIDRFRRIMTVYRSGPGGFTAQIVQENEIYRTDLLPGFELPLARLLALADEWRR
jgi:Uma2 family endonuclease